MSLSHRIEYWALIAVSQLLCTLPRSWALAIGSLIGSLGWRSGIRRQLVLSNIKLARPNASLQEHKSIGRQAAKNFGRTIAEFIRFGIKEREQIHPLVKVEGLEALKDALSQNKGAIVLTGHHGAWALYFAAVSMAGIPLSLLVGRQHNKKIDTFIHKIPGDEVELISKGRSAIRVILSKLQKGRAVVMVADQHAGKGGVVVPFLGKNASTLPLPGSLAVKYDIPVFIMTGQRLKDQTHKVQIRALDIPERATDEERKLEVLKRYNQELGAVVSECPEQYFWYHRRWREEAETQTS